MTSDCNEKQLIRCREQPLRPSTLRLAVYSLYLGRRQFTARLRLQNVLVHTSLAGDVTSPLFGQIEEAGDPPAVETLSTVLWVRSEAGIPDRRQADSGFVAGEVGQEGPVP